MTSAEVPSKAQRPVAIRAEPKIGQAAAGQRFAGVYARLAARSGDRIRHQSYNSHARREFIKARANDTILAAEMFSFFRQLHAVEYRGALLMVAENKLCYRLQAGLASDHPYIAPIVH